MMLSTRLCVFVLVWLVVCVPLTMAGWMRIANGAHFGGLLFGLGVAEAFYRSRHPAWKAAFAGMVALALLPAVWWPVSPVWQYTQGVRALQASEPTQALAYFQQAARGDSRLLLLTGIQGAYAELAAGRPDAAIAVFESLAGVAREAPEVLQADYHNSFAWMSATAPDPAARDGARAVREAALAAELSGFASAAILDTLAAAHAEAGDFQEAIRWQQQAIATNTDASLNPELAQRLAMYEAGHPYREAAAIPSDDSPR